MARAVCAKCRHAWTPRIPAPMECPKCKNRNWQKPSKTTRGDAKKA